MTKLLYRIIDADPAEALQILRFDEANDVAEVEKADGIHTTFQVWLDTGQIDKLTNSHLNYEKV